MKKRFLCLGAFVVACLSTICLLTGCGVTPKTFSTSDAKFSIELTSDFKAFSQDGLDLSLSTAKVGVFVSHETFEYLENYGYDRDMSLTEYAQLCIDNNQLTNILPSQDSERDLIYFEYRKTVDYNYFYYLAVVNKGTDSFWICNFACENEYYENYTEQFLDWATTIAVV